jgi:molecular chaperone GrpE (heat shock protein)
MSKKDKKKRAAATLKQAQNVIESAAPVGARIATVHKLFAEQPKAPKKGARMRKKEIFEAVRRLQVEALNRPMEPLDPAIFDDGVLG